VSLWLCAFPLCCLALLAGPLQDQPEVSSQQAAATFSSRVNLVSVPVVVRDSRGHAVGNLREEDFRLFDKGKQQIITKFSIQRNTSAAIPAATAANREANAPGGAVPEPLAGAEPAQTLPDRYVAYLFDDIHLNFADLSRIREAAQRHFASLTPGSRAAIFTTSGRLSLDFTDDRDKLRETLLKLAPSPTAVPPVGEGCPNIIGVYLADQVLNKSDGQAHEAAKAELTKCLPPEAITEGTIISYSELALAANRQNTQRTVNTLAEMVQRMSVMPGSRTIVLVSPGFLLLDDSRLREADLMERAIRSKIVISTLDARGLYTPLMGGAAENQSTGLSGRDPESIRLHYRRQEADADKDVMAELADGTGGKFFYNNNGFLEGLNELAAAPEYVYVLGFSPQNLKLDGSFHNLKVALVNPKSLELQARRGYWAPNHAVDPAEQAREEIKDAVFSQEEIREIPMEVQSEYFKLSDTQSSLTVSSHIDARNLRFAKSADRNDDTLTIVTGLFNPNGTYVKGIRRVVDLRLRDQTLESVRDAGLTIEESFEVAPGRYFVRVVVRDSQGQSMAARNAGVEIQ
jgi:VWFA-related protein